MSRFLIHIIPYRPYGSVFRLKRSEFIVYHKVLNFLIFAFASPKLNGYIIHFVGVNFHCNPDFIITGINLTVCVAQSSVTNHAFACIGIMCLFTFFIAKNNIIQNIVFFGFFCVNIYIHAVIIEFFQHHTMIIF